MKEGVTIMSYTWSWLATKRISDREVGLLCKGKCQGDKHDHWLLPLTLPLIFCSFSLISCRLRFFNLLSSSLFLSFSASFLSTLSFLLCFLLSSSRRTEPVTCLGKETIYDQLSDSEEEWSGWSVRWGGGVPGLTRICMYLHTHTDTEQHFASL